MANVSDNSQIPSVFYSALTWHPHYEVWKPVVGYEGYYEVSNYGRVKILKNIHNKNLTTFAKLEKTSFGYLRVSLTKSKISKKVSLHRLVAIHFVENKLNKSFINHEDGNKVNPHYLNLTWVTQSENILHAVKTGLLKGRAKMVYSFDKFGNRISTHKSVKACAEYYKINQSAVSNAIKIKGTIKGVYVSFNKEMTIPDKRYRHEVIEVCSNGNEINRFASYRQAAIFLNLKCPSFIRKVCDGKYRHYKGHYFKKAASLIQAGIAVDGTLLTDKK